MKDLPDLPPIRPGVSFHPLYVPDRYKSGDIARHVVVDLWGWPKFYQDGIVIIDDSQDQVVGSWKDHTDVMANKGLIETNVQNTFVISEKDLIGEKANTWVADNVAKGGLKEVKYSQILQYRGKPHGWLVTPGMRGDVFMKWAKDRKEHDQQWKQWWNFRPCLDV
jgi:hypothetical protein